MSGFAAIAYFLLSLFFTGLVFLLWARVGLRYFKISYLNSASQAIYALTNPLLKPIDRFFSSSQSRKSRYDWAAFTLILLVEYLKFVLISMVVFGQLPPWLVLPLYVIADVIIEPCTFLFYAIIIRVVMSWVNPTLRNPLIELIVLITEPLLQWTRKIIPPVYGLDFSPLFILVALKVMTLFVKASVAYPLA